MSLSLPFSSRVTDAASNSAAEGGEPGYRPVVQFVAQSRQHSEENRSRARAAILDWAGDARRWREGWRNSIPEGAYGGASFDVVEDALHLQVSTDPRNGLWCFHVEHSDSRQPDRTWKLEAFVADRDTHDEMGVRVFREALQGESVPSNTPALVRTFIAQNDLVDAAQALSTSPILVDSDEALDAFVSLLDAPERTLPVVAVSQAVSRTKSEFCAPPDLLARAIQGLAHVAAFAPAQSFHLSEVLGKPLSVYQGAVRVYQPAFGQDAVPHEHPLYLPEKIEISKTPYSFERAMARRLRFATVDSTEKLARWPQADRELVARGRSLSLFEGLRRALGLIRR